MTKNETLAPVDIDFSKIEIDTIAAAAHSCGQTVQEFMQETTAASRPKRRVVFVPCDSIPAFPFFKPLGQGAM